MTGLMAPDDERPPLLLHGDTSVAFAPDSRWLVTGGADHSVKIRSGLVGVVEATLTGHEAVVWSVAVSPDGRLIASGDNSGEIRFWDAERWDCLATYSGPMHANSMAFAPDGRTLAVGSSRMRGTTTTGGRITIYDVATRKPARFWVADERMVRRLCYSPDGRVLASVGSDQIIKIWDAASGQLQRSIDPHEERVVALAFTRDGTHLAVPHANEVRLWNVATGEVGIAFRGYPTDIHTIAFAADGNRLAVTGGRGSAIFDVRSPEAKPVMVSVSGRLWLVSALAFSPDGRRLAHCFSLYGQPEITPFQMIRLP